MIHHSVRLVRPSSKCRSRRLHIIMYMAREKGVRRPKEIDNVLSPMSHRHSYDPGQPHRWGSGSSSARWLAACSGNILLQATTNQTNDGVDDDIYRELVWISQQIQKHDDLYYTTKDWENTESLGAETLAPISDDEYDALVRREAELCQEHPRLLQRWEAESGRGKDATRFGGRVGTGKTKKTKKKTMAANATRTTKRPHLTRMLSLENVHTNRELIQWILRLRKAYTGYEDNESVESDVILYTEPKLDGVSLSLRYMRPTSTNNLSTESVEFDLSRTDQTEPTLLQLQWAATRGDGTRGQDVTAAIQQIPHLIPSSISSSSTQMQSSLEIRGEVVLPLSVFYQFQRHNKDTDAEKANETTKSTVFANARNAVSGILMRKEDTDQKSIILRSQLQFYAYDVAVESNANLLDGLELREQLLRWGFQVPEPIAVTKLSLALFRDLNDVIGDNEVNLQYNEQLLSGVLGYYDSLESHRDSVVAIRRKATDLPSTVLSSHVNNTSLVNNNPSADSDYIWGDYDMDGCVHKVSSPRLRQLLGTTNRAPKWAIAHKFPPRAAVTTLLNISVQVGRTGALTPVAVLQPVQIGGVMVQRATLHNFHVMRHVLGQTTNNVALSDCVPRGSLVMVSRAGDVIPQVVSRFDRVDPTFVSNEGNSDISLETPKKCPACGSDTIHDTLLNATLNKKPVSSSIDPLLSLSLSENHQQGQVLRCGGPALLCPPRAALALQHSFSRDALDITGLSEARISQLMEFGFLKLPGDLFRLVQNTTKLDELADLEGWGPKSVSNLAQVAISRATGGVTLARFLYSLGIRFVGIQTSALLASVYKTIDNFLNDVSAESNFQSSNNEDRAFRILQSEGQNEQTKGIGLAVISSLVSFSQEKAMVDAAIDLANMIRVLDDDTISKAEIKTNATASSDKQTNRPLEGLSVVFTGTFINLTREEAEKLARKMGAKSVTKSLSKSTGLLVIGSKAGNKKLEKAKSTGITMIREDEFQHMVNSEKQEV